MPNEPGPTPTPTVVGGEPRKPFYDPTQLDPDTSLKIQVEGQEPITAPNPNKPSLRIADHDTAHEVALVEEKQGVDAARRREVELKQKHETSLTDWQRNNLEI